MALFRKFFYRKPPEGLLEITERVYVFDCCFSTDVLEEYEYKIYMGGIVSQLRDQFLDASFMVFNFREGERQSQISNILSEYDMTVMDYPRHYEGCPLLPMEMIHHFLRSCESWLSLGQHNLLLMHCERGGWPVLAFMLAALLIYRRQYTCEQKTLDMIYKQAPRELLQLLSPLNPLPSQLRYLQYVSRRNVGSEWPPLDRALTLDCVILRIIPNFGGEGGCRPIFRIYGQDPFIAADRTPRVLFSTPKRNRKARLYKQSDCELVKIDIHCHIQGDVVLECISLDEDLEREEMIFRVMFNTAFIRSNILMLNRDEVDTIWNAKDQFSKDFRAEVLLSEMDASTSVITVDIGAGEEKEGLPMEAFAKVQEIFHNIDWLDHSMVQHVASSNTMQVTRESGHFREGCVKKVEQKIMLSDSYPLKSVQQSGDEYVMFDSPGGGQSSPRRLMQQFKSSMRPSSFEDEATRLKDSSLPLPRYHNSPSTLGIPAVLQVQDASKVWSQVADRSASSAHASASHSMPVNSVGSKSFTSLASAEFSEGSSLESHISTPSPSFPSQQLHEELSRLPLQNIPPTTMSVQAASSMPSCQDAVSAPCLNTKSSSSKNSFPPPPPPPLPPLQALSSRSSLPASPSPSLLTAPSLPNTAPPPPPTLPSTIVSSVSLLPLTTEKLATSASENATCASPSTSAPPVPPPPPLRSRYAPTSERPSPPPISQASSDASIPLPPPLGAALISSKGPANPQQTTGLKGAGVVPPPPALTPNVGAKRWGLSHSTSSKIQSTKKASLKPLHWVKVTRVMQGSLWAETEKHDEVSKAPEFDMTELENLFSAAISNSDGEATAKSNRRSSLGGKPDKIHLIDLRRANNCEIMLTKFKMPLPDIMSTLLALDDSILDADQVDNLIRFCPTKEEMELLKSFTGTKENLGRCEQFFLELMKVPRVESKLRVFSFKIQFGSQVYDLRHSLNIVNSAAEEIRKSAKLKRIMQTILSLGNALNQGTARGCAVGFKLDSLLKLSDTRARNNKMTLMHYLCKVIAEKLPELLDFDKDLVSLEAASKIQLKILAEEMQAINKGLEKVELELIASGNDGPISQTFHKTLKEFLVIAEAEVRSLTLLYSGAGRNADALAIYFGEDPARCPFEQAISTLLNFVSMFGRAHEENCKQIELEKKKLQKGAESERMKVSTPRKNSERLFDSLLRSSKGK